MNLPCCQHSLCQDPADPRGNFSAEKPDLEIFIGYNTGGWYGAPPTGTLFGSLGCTSFCQSTVSQEDADRCAAQQQIFCTTTECSTADCENHGGDGGWQMPVTGTSNYLPVAPFSNSQQECTVECADGLPFTFVVDAGKYSGLSQAQANAIAQSFACKLGESQKICLSGLPGGCVNEAYGAAITVTGGTPPYTFSVIGSLPPGLTGSQPEGEQSFIISGTPTVAGNYFFTVSVFDSKGLFMVKNYVMGIVGLNTPTGATKNSAYSFFYSPTGGASPYAYSISAGTLPPGLALNPSTGQIVGTPTTAGTYNFTIQITDSTP